MQKGDIAELEKVQKRATKLIISSKTLAYLTKKRLRKLKLVTNLEVQKIKRE